MAENQPFDPKIAQESIRLATEGLTKAQEAPSLALTVGYIGSLVRTREMADANTVLQAKNAELQAKLAEKEQTEAELRELATIDPLTGLANRRAFEENLESLVDSVNRGPVDHNPRSGETTSDKPHSLLMIDLDHFKEVNDEYGHAGGDQVLKDVAAILKKNSRQGDLAARIGGDEVALLLPRADDLDALKKADRIRKEIEALDNPVTASIGLGQLMSGESCADLLRRVDGYMYKAKSWGRNQVVSGSGLKRPDETSSTDGV